MSMAEPLCPDPPSVPAESHAPDAGPGMHWLAINLIAAWRGDGGAHRQTVVAQRLIELADEVGAAAVERAALGLADVAGTLLELYAASVGALPGDVLQEVATLMCDKSLWG
jgi:hypothetical protein